MSTSPPLRVRYRGLWRLHLAGRILDAGYLRGTGTRASRARWSFAILQPSTWHVESAMLATGGWISPRLVLGFSRICHGNGSRGFCTAIGKLRGPTKHLSRHIKLFRLAHHILGTLMPGPLTISSPNTHRRVL